MYSGWVWCTRCEVLLGCIQPGAHTWYEPHKKKTQTRSTSHSHRRLTYGLVSECVWTTLYGGESLYSITHSQFAIFIQEWKHRNIHIHNVTGKSIGWMTNAPSIDCLLFSVLEYRSNVFQGKQYYVIQSHTPIHQLYIPHHPLTASCPVGIFDFDSIDLIEFGCNKSSVI